MGENRCDRSSTPFLALCLCSCLQLSDSPPRRISTRSCWMPPSRGDISTIGVLLDAGADPNAGAPLSFAASNGHIGAISVLLDAGADADETGGRAFSPLHFAALAGHAEAVDALLDAGADPNAEGDFSPTTPLHWAAQMGHVRTIVALLRAGADAYAKDLSGRVAARTRPRMRTHGSRECSSERANSGGSRMRFVREVLNGAAGRECARAEASRSGWRNLRLRRERQVAFRSRTNGQDMETVLGAGLYPARRIFL